MGDYTSPYFGVLTLTECFDMDNGLHFRRRKCYMYEAQILATLYLILETIFKKRNLIEEIMTKPRKLFKK